MKESTVLEGVKAEPQNQVAVLPPLARAEVVLNVKAQEVALAELVKKSVDITEVANVAARTQVHQMYMDLKNARVGITKNGEAARDDANAFSAAVIATEKKLISITSAEEKRLMALRDGFDEKVKAEAAAKAKAEHERVTAIQARIQELRNSPLTIVGKPSSEIAAAISALQAIEITEELYGELIFHGQAMAAKADAIRAMEVGYGIAKDQEQAAEDARLAAEEQARLLTEQAAENARVAAELKVQQEALAEAQRVAAEAAAVEAARVAEEQRAAAAAFALQQAKALADAAEAARIMQEGAERAKAAQDAAAALIKEEQDRIAAAQAAESQRLADLQAEFGAKLAAQAQADPDRKEAIRVAEEQEALAEVDCAAKKEINRINHARVEEVAALVRMEDPSAYVVVTEFKTELPNSILDDDAQLAAAFRIAARALLEVCSAADVISILEDVITQKSIIECMSNDD